jgi:hypothetical protein
MSFSLIKNKNLFRKTNFEDLSKIFKQIYVFFLLTKSKTFLLIIFNSKLTKSKFLFNTIFTNYSKFIFTRFLLTKNLDRFLFCFFQNQNTFSYLQIKSILSFYGISFHLPFQIKTFFSNFDLFRKNKNSSFLIYSNQFHFLFLLL